VTDYDSCSPIPSRLTASFPGLCQPTSLPRLQLAANWSAALAALLAKVEPPLEYLKPLSTHDAVLACRARPLLLHLEARIGAAKLPELPSLAHSVYANAPFISLHLDVQPEDASNARIASRQIAANVAQLQNESGLVVALENMPHYGWSERQPYVTDPAWISDTLAASGAYLLFDLAHARVAAHHRGVLLDDYLAALPLARSIECHLSAPRLERDGLRDRHMALTEADYSLLEKLLPQMPILRLLTLEYGGIPDLGRSRDGGEVRLNRNDKNLLLEQLARLDTLRKRHNGTLRQAQMLPVGWHLDNGWNYEYLELLEMAA
jgi:uncharacterized protein